MEVILIVGNKFRDFCDNENVITISQFKHLFCQDKLNAFPSNTRLMAGQGIREFDVQQILDEAGSDLAIDLSELKCRPARASRIHTHKSKMQNSIISHPIRLNDTQFEMALMLDERSELMSDHQTGQHIQGMVLIEAARQAFLAVTEEYFIGSDDHRRYYFVINSIDVEFHGFVFPVDAVRSGSGNLNKPISDKVYSISQ